MFMTSARVIADTTPTRTDLRLVVLAQWIRAGLAMTRAAATGRGLVGGAVALWRLAQAVRLAILLARRLKHAQGASRVSAPCFNVSGPASTPVPAWSLEAAPMDDAALERALAELEATIANARGLTPHRRTRAWERERPARIPARASQEARGPSRRPLGRATPPPAPPARTRPTWPATMAHAGRPEDRPDPDRPQDHRARGVGQSLKAPPERGLAT
jgi:hypothetical protein